MRSDQRCSIETRVRRTSTTKDLNPPPPFYKAFFLMLVIFFHCRKSCLRMLSALMGTRFVKIDLFLKKVMQQVDDVFRAFRPIQGEGGGIEGDADSTDGSLV